VRALLIALLVLAAHAAFAFAKATGADHPGLPWADIIKQALNFGILVGILVYFLRKPLSNFLRDRREILIKAMEEASRANAEAKEKLAEVEEKIAHLDKEVEELNRSMEKEAEAEFERIKSLTKDEIERIKEQATVAAELVVKKAREELRKEAAELSVKSAEEIVSKTITDEDQKRFIKENLEKIKGAQE
jgi:F-type H+-transporting ATPase subunit b